MHMRGMAGIKALLAVSAAGVVWWRLGQPVRMQVAASYIACTWALFASTALIWQLAFIPMAAIVFHAGDFIGLVIAFYEDRPVPASAQHKTSRA
jgi:hypothetical protein